MQRPFRSQSPYRVGSGPFGPFVSLGDGMLPSTPLSWRQRPRPLICRTLSCQLSCLSICPLIPAKTSGDGMPADSTTPKSKPTQLTNRPKLLLAPGTDSQRPKARAKPAGKTGTGPHRDNQKRPHGTGQARPTPATGPKSRQPARRSSKPGKKRIVAPVRSVLRFSSPLPRVRSSMRR